GRCAHISHGEHGLEQGFDPCDRRRHDDQRRISETSANRFCLTSFVSKAPESSLHTGAIKTLLAELARAIRKVVRGDDAVAAFERADGWPHIFHKAHPFMPYLPPGRIGTLSPIRPEISTANTRVSDPYESVSGLQDAGIGYLLNPSIECSAKHSCPHVCSPSVLKLPGEMFSYMDSTTVEGVYSTTHIARPSPG